MLPILGIVTSELEKGNLLMNVICTELGISQEEILDFDLYLADATPACTFGVHNEFISSGRLDDLSMCFAGLEAMIATETVDATKVLAIFDNEETGSQTKQGAGSPFLSMMLKRIALAQSGSEEAYYQAVERAFMISADNAHAWHPNPRTILFWEVGLSSSSMPLRNMPAMLCRLPSLLRFAGRREFPVSGLSTTQMWQEAAH